tara:strand:+ start:771 stop:929 length:159 start_codon:yes stop_codon:yes gene_type:complete
MLQTIFNFLVLLAFGVILVFAVGTALHFKLKKQNKLSREEALKVQSDEPSDY